MEKKRKLQIPNQFSLLDKRTYTAYREFSDTIEGRRFRVVGRVKLLKILKVICKHIGKNIVERNGGVLIKNFGYFFVWKIPKKQMYRRIVKGKPVQELYNHHTNNYMYSPIFLPIRDKNRSYAFGRWSMDHSFTRSVKQGIKEKIIKGFKYKMYAFSIRKLYRL